MQCPKCKTEAANTARFCPRCHATLLFKCPACKHQQRRGGICEECGVDFLKYATAVVAVNKAQADVNYGRLARRSKLLKNILLTPFDMGISVLRQLLRVSGRRDA